MTMEIWNITRKKAVIINMGLIMLLSLPAVFGFNILSGIQPMGTGSTIMDLEDFLVSYNILPLGGLVFVLFCTKKNGWGYGKFEEEVNTGNGFKLPRVVKPLMKYVIPCIIVLVYLKGYYDMFSPMGMKTLAIWMLVAALFLVMVFGFTFRKKEKKTN